MTSEVHVKTLRYVLLVLVLFPFFVIADDDDDDSMGWLVPANSAAKNFFGTLRVGYGDNDYPGSNQDGSVTGVRADENDTVFSISGGYRFTDNVAIQAAYHDFGNSEFSGTSSGGPSWEAGPVSALHDADGWELGVLGRWPVSDRWYVLGFVGYLFWESKETFVETSGISVLEESGSDVSYALGVEYDVGMRDRFFYRFMGAHHQVGDFGYNINSASAEIVYVFP
jgi:hypothetical protein